jgi:hypothetical protein
VRLSLELNQNSISAAVNTYIRHKVNDLQRLINFGESKRDEITQCLTANANHTFLLVVLVCERLKDPQVRLRHISSELQRLPAGLNSLYGRMIKSVDGSLDADVCYDILAAVSVLYQPISLLELRIFLDELEHGTDINDLRDIMQRCGSFLAIREEVLLCTPIGERLPSHKRNRYRFPSKHKAQTRLPVLEITGGTIERPSTRHI